MGDKMRRSKNSKTKEEGSLEKEGIADPVRRREERYRTEMWSGDPKREGHLCPWGWQ